MKSFTKIKKCRLCKSNKIKEIINFGSVALANAYVKNPKKAEKKFPLTLVSCQSCGHIQIKETILPKILFKHYFYKSSDSKYLQQYFKQYANDIKKIFSKNKCEQVLEIGCNCGLLMDEMSKQNFCKKIIGVDPASNIIPKTKNNLIFYNDFFNKQISENIVSKHGKFSIIIANNVFAHMSEIDSVTDGVKNALDENGIFVFENAYGLSTIKGLYFDQIYHEHLQYFNIKPIQKYLKKYQLELFDVKFNNNQGGSIRCFVKHAACKKYNIKKSVNKFINLEENFGLYKIQTFKKFICQLNIIKNKVEKFLKFCKKNKKTISCYGCPAKFALFSKFFNLSNKNIKYVVDDTPIKQGMFSPESKIKIVNNNYFQKYPTDYCIISAWNVADFIIGHNKSYKGKFVNIFSDKKFE